jgi:hypothetical protein
LEVRYPLDQFLKRFFRYERCEGFVISGMDLKGHEDALIVILDRYGLRFWGAPSEEIDILLEASIDSGC